MDLSAGDVSAGVCFVGTDGWEPGIRSSSVCVFADVSCRDGVAVFKLPEIHEAVLWHSDAIREDSALPYLLGKQQFTHIEPIYPY